MPKLVISDVDGDADVRGSLFDNASFFLIQRVPLRSHFIDKIEANGGRVVKLEAQAQYIIADHKRGDAPAGSLSYTFIEEAIKIGGLPDEDAHLISRPQATISRLGPSAPVRNTRTPFTADEDRFLYNWVKTAEAQGVAIKGNEIYKQLEAKYPRHTYQSWRDRYIRYLTITPPSALPAPPDGRSTSNLGASNSVEPADKPALHNRQPPGAITTTRQVNADSAEPMEEPVAPRHKLPISRRPVIGATRDADGSGEPMEKLALPRRKPVRAVRSTRQDSDDSSLAPSVSRAAAGRTLLRARPDARRSDENFDIHLSSSLRPAERRTDKLATTAQNGTAMQPASKSTASPRMLKQAPKKESVHDIQEEPVYSEDMNVDPPVQPTFDAIIEPRQKLAFKGFEDDMEYLEEWVRGAAVIQSIPVGRYGEAWQAIAKEDPRHTAEEWRLWYEHVVLPKHYENEDENEEENKEENVSVLSSRTKGPLYRQILKVFGTQGQPPYTPSKHSDMGSVPRVTPHGQLFAATLTPAPLSKRPVTPRSEPRQETGATAANLIGGDRVDQKYPEGFANKSPKRKLATNTNIRGEAQKRLRVEETSSNDSNERRKGTLPRNPLQRVQVLDIMTLGSDVPSDGDDYQPSALPTSDVEAAVQTQVVGKSRAALTAENLALAQASHNVQRTRRGVDLLQDDEEKDQDDYLLYLEGLVGTVLEGSQEEAMPPNRAQSHVIVDADGSMIEPPMQEQVAKSDESFRTTSPGLRETSPLPAAEVDEQDQEQDQYALESSAVPVYVETQDVDPNLSPPLPALGDDGLVTPEPDLSPLDVVPVSSQDVDPNIDADEEVRLILPEPEGGWVYSSQSSLPPIPDINTVISPRRDKGKGRAIDTGEVFEAQTLDPDLDIPDPDMLSVESPAEQTAGLQEMTDPEVEAYSDQLLKADYPGAVVVNAFMCTSLRAALVERFLQAWDDGQGVPSDIAGIWTEEDDIAIDCGDAVKLRLLDEKHGSTEVEARRKFLEKVRA